ncbi:uncharacterized protein LOC127246949 isoform X2 [Andrographis paniculata]|uniref:uncharacterized protein LOC127246949 isoform X2 n=1 Tax=Andrographis paniculata TaxID=175694 RepID=UPI0021E7A497|nr:uncharacterized protein LOC127246949 isoform X2 [Andrographis paniculata]
MLPHFNNFYGSNTNNVNNNRNAQSNGVNASAPQQIIGNQGTFCPNPSQIQPQFPMGMLNNPQMGMLNNPQMAMLNPNPYFAPGQFFPFPQGSFMNPNVDLAHIFGRNSMNQPPFLPNGVPNLPQNINQLLQVQIPNAGPNNVGPFMNSQLGVHNGTGTLQQQSIDGKGRFNSPQVQQNQILRSPGAAKSQNDSENFNGINDGKNSWRKSHNTKFMNNKNNASQRGFGKPFHQRQNAQGRKFNDEYQGKGNRNNGQKNFPTSTSSEKSQEGKKRSLVLNYTEQEIRQWREQRRNNYPSKANIEKKLKENSIQPEITDEAVKMRRQQLKEILAKQAELGCEVAEIPSSYLLDSEPQPHNKQQQQNGNTFGQRGRFQNKFNQKRKFHQNDRSSKRPRPETNHRNTNPHRDNKREPSLLKKLLSLDIKRDKKHLLQVFKFMVMNSFFQNEGDDLKFPTVIVKESDDLSKPIEEEAQVANSDASDPLAPTPVDNHMC